jgi:putative glycosyltransferase (TIGR04372 family)
MDWHGNYLIFIPKRFWSNVEKRFLTFAEIFRLGAHLFSMTWQYRREGIEWVDNDVDEIRAVVLEMEQRLSGSWVSNPEDEELQSRFRSIWPLRQNGRPLQARIGADFLRQHPELLG